MVDSAIDCAKTQAPAGPLAVGRTFGQSFTARRDGLAAVEVMVATYAAQLPGGDLSLHLRLSGSQKDIASVTIPANSIRDNSYVELQFAPIHDSRGKRFYFYLETHGIPAKYAITVWRSRTDIYSGGQFYTDRDPQDQDVCFRALDYSQDVSALENSLVMSNGEGRLYLIRHGERHWILDPRWLAANGYSFKQPLALTISQLRKIPVGSCLTYMPLSTKIEIGTYTGLLFLFFFLTIYRQEWLQRNLRRIPAGFRFAARLDSRVLLFVGFVFLMWLREPSWIAHPHFWAEEGTTWFQCASTHSLVQDLFYIYPQSGYFNLMANVGGALSSSTAHFVSLEYAPLSTVLAAFCIQALAIAIILFGKSRLFTTRPRAVAGCLIVLFASTSVSEVWLNTINSMSYLGLIALVLLFEDVSAWPRWLMWIARVVLVLCGLSAAYSIALLPLFLFSFFRYRERERKMQCFILAGCLLIQIGCVIFSKFAGGGLPNRGVNLSFDTSSIDVLFGHIVMPALGVSGALFLFGVLDFTGAWLAASSFPHVPDPSMGIVGLVSFLVIVGILWLLLGRKLDINKLLLEMSFVILVILTCVGSLHSIPFGRYAFLPGLIFLLLLLVNIESSRGRIRSTISMMILSFALANGIVTYRLPPDPNEPAWSGEVARWRADHHYRLRVWPSFWTDRITYSSN